MRVSLFILTFSTGTKKRKQKKWSPIKLRQAMELQSLFLNLEVTGWGTNLRTV